MSTLKIKWSSVFLFDGAKRFMLPVGVCLAGSSYLGSLTPPLIADLVNNYGQEELYYRTMKYILYVFIGTYFNRALFQLSINKYVQLLMRNVRILCYGKWLNGQDLQSSKKSNRDDYPLGEVLARIMSDSESIRELVTSGSFRLLIDIFFVSSCLISFINLNSTTGIVIAVGEIIAVILLIVGSKYMREIFLSVRKSRGYMSRAIANIVGGVEESYYTKHEDYAKKKSESYFDDYLNKVLHSNFWDAAYYSVAESLFPLFLIVVVLVVPYSNVAQAGIIFAVIDLVQRSISPIKDMSGKIANIQRAMTGMQRTSEFISEFSDSEVLDISTDERILEVQKMEIRIESFSYKQERDVTFLLKDVNFELKQGQMIGVIGYSGSGKSTLLDILAGNIIPDKGDVLLHGVNGKISSFPGKNGTDLLNYRMLVSSVSQDSHIFSETLAFNLSLTSEKLIELDEFWDFACEQIPYLLSWGIKLQDEIIPKELSMGQRQLLAGLRACFLKKAIVLFDEISSGLDSNLEKALRELVLLIQKSSLTIIVAHRLETIIEASEILVMDDGRVSAKGVHKDLLQSSEIYQKFIKELSH